MAGIDAWLIYEKAQIIRALASRVQWKDGNCWETFTIRYERMSGAKTEYKKRLDAIRRRDSLYPHYTLHAYLGFKENGYEFLGVGRVLTEHLYLYADEWLYRDEKRAYLQANGDDGNIFICVPWDSLSNDGIKVHKIVGPLLCARQEKQLCPF